MRWHPSIPVFATAGAAAALSTALLLTVDTDASDRPANIGAILLVAALSATTIAIARNWGLAFVAIIFGACAFLAADYTVLALYPPVVVALFWLGNNSRPSALASGAVTMVVGSAAMVFLADDPIVGWETVSDASALLAPVAIGDAMRSRRQETIALRNRAELAEQSARERATHEIQQERLRIARDLHDVLSHTVTAINVQAGVLRHTTELPPETGSAVDALHDTTTQALGELRGLLTVLRSSDDAPVRPSKGWADVPPLIASFRGKGVDVRWTHDLDPTRVSALTSATAYHVLAEALANAARHAPGAAVRCDASEVNAALVLTVSNPLLSATGTTGAGFGIIGMRERVRAAGGTLSAGASHNEFAVNATIPLDS